MTQPDSSAQRPAEPTDPDINPDDGSSRPADAARPENDGSPLPSAVARLTSSDLDSGERKQLLGRIASSVGDGSRRGLRRFIIGPGAVARWALDTLIDIAPHLPVRDLETLREHHDSKSGDELAEALIRNASRVTAAIGAAGGGVAAIEWVATPSLLSAPVLIGAETVAVVAVEVKLIGELHEVYGVPVRGSAAEKATQLLGAWAQRRGVSLFNPARGLTTVLGVGVRKDLRDRLVKRMGRNLTTLGPMLTGAAVAAELNRRATKAVGELVREDLRGTAAQRRALPPGH
jgi:hypothetical protein